jgi:hypothetical protein
VVRITGAQSGSSRRRGLDPIHARHLDVEQGDVGLMLAGGREHLVAAGDLGDHLQVGLEAEQRGEGAAHHPLVLRDQDPDHRSAVSGSACGDRAIGVVIGTRATSRKPPPSAVSTSSEPPASAIRSLSPRRPLP